MAVSIESDSVELSKGSNTLLLKYVNNDKDTKGLILSLRMAAVILATKNILWQCINSQVALGDWSQKGILESYSGGAWYRRSIGE